MHQPRRGALVAELRRAELRLDPPGVVQRLLQSKRGDPLALRPDAHVPAPMPVQHADVDVLARNRRPPGTVASAPGALADAQPVGGPVAGPLVLRGVHEALQQPRLETVPPLEIRPDALRHHAQHPAGKVLAPHTGADEKPPHAQHPVLELPAHRPVPSDPLVAGGQPQGAGAEPHRSQPAVVRTDQVAQLPPHHPGVFQRMLGLHQLVPCPDKPVVLRPHLHKLQPADLSRPGRHPVRRLHRPAQPPRPPAV